MQLECDVHVLNLIAMCMRLSGFCQTFIHICTCLAFVKGLPDCDVHILSLYQIVIVSFCHKFKPYCDVCVLIWPL